MVNLPPLAQLSGKGLRKWKKKAICAFIFLGTASSHLEDNTYGVDPAIKSSVSAVIEEKSVPLPSVKNRGSHLEAMTIVAFAAEKGLSLSDMPDLIEFVKVGFCECDTN